MNIFRSTYIAKWAMQPIQHVLNSLQTSRKGLTFKEAQLRIKQYETHVIPSKESGLFKLFLKQFNDLFVYLLIIAAFLSFAIGEAYNSYLILSFVILDVLFSFYQEARAHKTLFYLNKKLASASKVIRDNTLVSLDQSLLVPGDIVLCQAGDIVPADIRIFEEHNLIVDESILTGESTNIVKSSEPLESLPHEVFEIKNILFAGSYIMSGQTLGAVVAIGKDTQIGAIAKVVAQIRSQTGYVKNVKQLSTTVALIALVSIPLIVMGQAIIHPETPVGDLIIFTIALIVGIIPEAFPAIISFSLGHAAIHLAQHNVIVKRLSAIEDLGDIEVLCVDKTGTLTENKMQLDQVISQDRDTIFLMGILSITNPEFPTSFDKAIIAQVPKYIKHKAYRFKRIAEIPFDSERMRSSVLVQDQMGNNYLIVRGAPESLISVSTKFDQQKSFIKEYIQQKGYEGKRTLAIAIKRLDNHTRLTFEDEKNLLFLGFFSFFDPVKKSVKATLLSANQFGIEIKILTGDAHEVSFFVAKQVGLITTKEKVISAVALVNMTEEAFEKACCYYTVFTRVTPLMKLKIVKTLQKKYSVGFLGEGINDAPALKAAHVGIAVKEAVDVAREAADIVVLEKNLSILIFAIKEGRKIFVNIDTYIKTTLASTLGNYYSIGFLALILPFIPILPIQILLVNLLSDFPLLAISTDRVLLKDLKKPKQYQLHKGFLLIVCLAIISMFSDIALFVFYKNLPVALIRTLWFILSVLTELGLIFIVRNHHFFCSKPYPSMLLIGVSIMVAVSALFLPFTGIGQTLFAFSIPTMKELMAVCILIASYLAMSEMVKVYYFKKVMRKTRN